jgi:superfamily II DNA helicase RecQ
MWASKDESLTSWIAGNQKIIVATGALGSSIDVNGICLVVHLGRPQSVIDFIQEAGRGGRQDEEVQSIILLSQTELNWLRDSSTKEPDPYKEVMRRYIATAGCRRLILSGYFDVQANDCEGLKARQCDNCSSQMAEMEDTMRDECIPTTGEGSGSGSVALRATFREEAYYAKGIELREARVKAEAMRIRRVEEALQRMEDQCPACQLMNPLIDHHHNVDGCIELTTLLKQPYREVRQRISFVKNSCCFSCSLPGDWCPSYRQRQRCAGPNLALPLVLAAWLWPETRDLVHRMANHEFSSIDEYTEWLVRPCRIYGTKGTNVMVIFEAVAENRQL